MTIATCPRCGQPLPEGTHLEELGTTPGWFPAYRLRHPRRNGGHCVAYVGPEMPTVPPPTADAAQGEGRAT